MKGGDHPVREFFWPKEAQGKYLLSAVMTMEKGG
jgi:hypothetical protein